MKNDSFLLTNKVRQGLCHTKYRTNVLIYKTQIWVYKNLRYRFVYKKQVYKGFTIKCLLIQGYKGFVNIYCLF